MKNISLISWNVNGVRAAERKGFLDWLYKNSHDIVCIQETKVSDPCLLSEALLHPDGYNAYWACATEKKGYSGVAVFSKIAPREIKTDFGDNIISKEGRVLQLEFENFTLLNVYFPNGGASAARLRYKLEFYKEFLSYVKRLIKNHHKIIFCGDVNTAHREIDLARPKENIDNSGFMPVERVWLDKFAATGFIDTWRFFHPDKKDAYTWWDMKTRARERNVGWRIDYFFAHSRLKDNLLDVAIMSDVMGSDHCPIGIKLKIHPVK